MKRQEFVVLTAAATLAAAALGAAFALRVLAAPAVGGKAPEGYTDTPMQPEGKWHVHDPNRPLPRVVTPGKRFSQEADGPSDAIVLFDGKDLSKWQGKDGEAKWKVENGYVETSPGTGTIRTKDEFGDMQIHIEWATPTKVVGDGQGRGNNGLNIYGLYEVQILDSYENATYADGQAGSIYGQAPPLVNASRPPGEWQTYDVVWEGPRWDAGGKLTRKGSMTVLHNGVVIHNKRELWGNTSWRAVGNYDKPHPPRGYIELYEHGNPVRFRNIWVRPLGEYDQVAEGAEGAEGAAKK